MAYTEEEHELSYDSQDGRGHGQGYERMREERRRREAEEEMKEQWPQTEAARVFTQLAEAFTACQKLVEQYPEIQANGEAGRRRAP